VMWGREKQRHWLASRAADAGTLGEARRRRKR
jgi:hypothetical protein